MLSLSRLLKDTGETEGKRGAAVWTGRRMAQLRGSERTL